MRRTLGVACFVAGLSLLTVQPGVAQWRVAIGGGGAIVPVSDYGEFAKTGWGVTGRLAHALNDKASLGVTGSYGSNSHEDEGDKTNLIGVGGNLVYSLTESGETRPFVVAGAGYLGHQYKSDNFPDDEATDWQAYVNGGVWTRLSPRGRPRVPPRELHSRLRQNDLRVAQRRDQHPDRRGHVGPRRSCLRHDLSLQKFAADWVLGIRPSRPTPFKRLDGLQIQDQLQSRIDVSHEPRPDSTGLLGEVVLV